MKFIIDKIFSCKILSCGEISIMRKGSRLKRRNDCLNKSLFKEGWKGWSLSAFWEEFWMGSPNNLFTYPIYMVLFVLFHYCQQDPLPYQHRTLSPCMVKLKLCFCVLQGCDIRRFQTLALLAVFKSWYDTAFGDTSQVCQGELKWNGNCNRKKADSNVLMKFGVPLWKETLPLVF